jgi:hypothetical protein
VHDDVELVYRITPNIKDVEGSVSSTTDLQSFMSIDDLIFFDAIPIIITENDSAEHLQLYFFDASFDDEAEHPYYEN